MTVEPLTLEQCRACSAVPPVAGLPFCPSCQEHSAFEVESCLEGYPAVTRLGVTPSGSISLCWSPSCSTCSRWRGPVTQTWSITLSEPPKLPESWSVPRPALRLRARRFSLADAALGRALIDGSRVDGGTVALAYSGGQGLSVVGFDDDGGDFIHYLLR